MCEPTTLAIMSVAAGGLQYMGQVQAAKDQGKANQRSTELILQNQALQIRALQNQEDEDQSKTSKQIRDNAKAADAARSTAAVAAGEAGVSGLSVDALMGDLTLQESMNKQDLLTSQDYRQRQRQLDREGTGITSQSQINQLPSAKAPSFAEFALGTAIDGIGTYQTAYARQAAAKLKTK